VRFSWTDDQIAFAAATRDVLAKECPPAAVRAAWAAPAGRLDRTAWDALDELGVTGVTRPADAGGLGLDECTLVPILEETGRVALPHPVVESCAVAAPLAIGPPGRLVASDLGGPLVSGAADADVLLLVRPSAAGEPQLWAVEPTAARVTPVPTVDGARRAGRVGWDVADGGGRLVADDPAAVALAVDRGVVGVAAQQCGLAAAMLDLTVAYVGERRQFGVPIGSFQAVKHHLADALLRLELARPAVARAAWSLAQADGPDGVDPLVRGRDASMAKALATDAADVVGRAALQCHGAIGYTVEHDLHLFLKRSWALARAWGDRDAHAERVGRALARSGGPDPVTTDA
jgi:hypothetical protein